MHWRAEELVRTQGQVKGFPKSAGSSLPSAQNNPHAKAAHIGVTSLFPFTMYSFQNHGALNGLKDRVSITGPEEGHITLLSEPGLRGLKTKSKMRLSLCSIGES